MFSTANFPDEREWDKKELFDQDFSHRFKRWPLNNIKDTDFTVVYLVCWEINILTKNRGIKTRILYEGLLSH